MRMTGITASTFLTELVAHTSGFAVVFTCVGILDAELARAFFLHSAHLPITPISTVLSPLASLRTSDTQVSMSTPMARL